MIKISANISKKVPIPGTEFSSQQYGAAMEIEVSDADQPDVIQGRIRDLYGLVTQAVDEQIAAATQAASGNNDTNGHEQPPQPVRQSSAPAPAPPPANTGRASYRNGGNGGNGSRTNGNGINGANAGNGRKTGATDAQQRAIFAICKSLNLDLAVVLADLNVTDAGQLSVKDASRLIDDLKNRQNDTAQQPRR